MSNNATPLTSKLTGYDFHSYLDGQINDEDFARIEKTVSTNPKVILQLQQCIMIGERFQDMYGEPVTGPMKNSQQFDDRPHLHEPALVNDDENLESDDALVAVDALELGNDESYSTSASAAIPSNDMPLGENFEDALESDEDEDYQEYTPQAAVNVFEEHADEQYQSEFNDDLANKYSQGYSENLGERYDSDQADSLNDPNSEEIQVENLLQGISEVEALSLRHDDPMVGQIHGMELYSHPDRGWLANKLFSAKDWIRAKISLYRYKIQQKRLNKLLNESNAQAEFDNMPEYANEFDYNIDSEIEAHDPPRWQFWKPRAPKIHLDADVYHEQANDPFGYTQRGKLAQLQEWTWNLLNKLHIPEHRHNHVLVAGLAVFSFLFGMLLSSKPIAMDSTTLIYQAIDAHKYYASRGFDTLYQGLPNVNADLTIMAKTIGTKLEPFSLDKTDFQRTGSTLLPSINGYASMQLFQNKSKQNVSLFATAWHDPELHDQHVTCKVPAGISSVCVWQDDDFYYAMTSDISLSRVRTFAEKLASQPRP